MYIIQIEPNGTREVYTNLCAKSLHGLQVQDGAKGETTSGSRLGLLYTTRQQNSESAELPKKERSCFSGQRAPGQKISSCSSVFAEAVAGEEIYGLGEGRNKLS